VIVDFYLHSCCYAVICLSCYLVIFCLYLSGYYSVHIVYMHELSPLHTLIRSLSDDPEFTRLNIGRFVSIVQVFEETVLFVKSWSFSLFDSGTLIFLIFILFSDSRYIRFICYSSSLYDIMRGCLYVLLQWSLTHYSINL